MTTKPRDQRRVAETDCPTTVYVVPLCHAACRSGHRPGDSSRFAGSGWAMGIFHRPRRDIFPRRFPFRATFNAGLGKQDSLMP